MKTPIENLIALYPIGEATANAMKPVLAAVIFDMLEEDCGSPICLSDYLSIADEIGWDAATEGGLAYAESHFSGEPGLPPIGDIRWRM